MPYEPPPELAALSLAQVAELVQARGIAPLDQWQPQETGESAMRIAADGRWFHEGSEIVRPAMVRAFSSLLSCDADGRHWLVTPTQRLAIAVEDAAFVATDMRCEDGAIAFRLNTDEFVIAGPDHPITSEGDPERPALYVAVRHGTRARLNRSTYAQLVELALASPRLEVESRGVRFSLIPA